MGTYNINVAAGGRVTDSSGLASAATAGSFSFNAVEDSTFGGGGSTPGSVSLPFTAQTVLDEANGSIVVVGLQGDPTGGSSQGVLELLTVDGSGDRHRHHSRRR